MDKISLWNKFLKYAKNPVTPSSAGILAIINGVFAPFAYVPLSSVSGRLLTESFEPISLFNRGSGIAVIILTLISYVLLIRKKYVSALILAGVSALIVIIEAYWVTVIGQTGRQYSSIYDPDMFFPRGPLVVYDLAVRARLGNAIGYLFGGHISFFFAVVMGRNQIRRRGGPSHIIKNSRLRIFLGIVLLLVVISALLYYFLIMGGQPIVETHLEGFVNP